MGVSGSRDAKLYSFPLTVPWCPCLSSEFIQFLSRLLAKHGVLTATRVSSPAQTILKWHFQCVSLSIETAEDRRPRQTDVLDERSRFLKKTPSKELRRKNQQQHLAGGPPHTASEGLCTQAGMAAGGNGQKLEGNREGC